MLPAQFKTTVEIQNLHVTCKLLTISNTALHDNMIVFKFYRKNKLVKLRLACEP